MLPLKLILVSLSVAAFSNIANAQDATDKAKQSYSSQITTVSMLATVDQQEVEGIFSASPEQIFLQGMPTINAPPIKNTMLHVKEGYKFLIVSLSVKTGEIKEKIDPEEIYVDYGPEKRRTGYVRLPTNTWAPITAFKSILSEDNMIFLFILSDEQLRNGAFVIAGANYKISPYLKERQLLLAPKAKPQQPTQPKGKAKEKSGA